MSVATQFLVENPNFAGVLNAVEPIEEWEKPTPREIEDDVDGEQEALGLPTDTNDDHEQDSDVVEDFQQLQSTLQEASKGVSEGTHNEYKRFDSDDQIDPQLTLACIVKQIVV
jgi:hypothetical protein